MVETVTHLQWESGALAKYNNMVVKIPLFHREIAKQVVEKKAELNAKERGSVQVEEPDIVRAFFSEVPKAFYSLMIRLMDVVGFNHKDYEQK
ncbi:MAG TPA: hypothetical protein DD723_08730 [Candidatus Omnitrophica bacterium]|nr:MAG: hypothetical protein A2Z81_07035 [Omnitrophica WOR_2 bacterium GWA2_45_18]HBR15603.1 hypothetical protein [Candidatus Omnitrophota bacterium]